MGRWVSRLGWLALAAVAFAPAASQARSFSVVSLINGDMTLVDTQAVQVDPVTGLRQAWVVTVQGNILSSDPPQPGYVRMLSEYDCAKLQVRWKTFSAYNRIGGLLLKQDNKSGDWKPAAPGEALAGLMLACGFSKGDTVLSGDTMATVVLALLNAFDPAPPAAAKLPEPAKAPAKKPAAKPR